MGKTILKILAVLFVLGWVLDFLFPSTEERWLGESPIAYFERSGKTLEVYGNMRDSASRLVKMNIFGRLHPSYSVNKVTEIVGEPIEVLSPEAGVTRLVYRSSMGKLWYEATRVQGGVTHNVSFIPFDAKPESTLSRKVTSHLRTHLQGENVTIYNCDDNYFQFHISLEEGLVRKIVWVDSEAYNRSFGREKRGACVAENKSQNNPAPHTDTVGQGYGITEDDLNSVRLGRDIKGAPK
jgi:hypothetical protein